MVSPPLESGRSAVRLLGIAVVGAVISACQSVPPASRAPSPPLQMVRSGELTLPPACEASGSVVVAYTVYEDGRTGSIDVPAAPTCVQQALTHWVASFRYSPQSAQVAASIEWMLVEAKKGS